MLRKSISWVAAGAMVLLGGCINLGKSERPALVLHDLGPVPAANVNATALNLRSVDVVAPSWLDTPAMQYRLAYADATRRASYAESRWVAPPAELLQQTLRRRIASAEGRMASGGCRLRVDVDEFVQRFDSSTASQGVIEVRASLLAARGDALVAKQSFSAARPATSADAHGGVAALSGATADLAASLREWLDGLDRDAATAQRCRGG